MLCKKFFFTSFLFAASYQNSQGTQSENDPDNTTVGILVQFCSYTRGY